MMEREAKLRWCPFARVIAFNHQQQMVPASINRTRGLGEEPKCLASGCMAWRQSGEPAHGECGLVGGGAIPQSKSSDHGAEPG